MVLIDDDGFELGMPTVEEMTEHQVALLTHEAEQARHLLAKARRDIEKLVLINAEQAERIRSLQLDLNSTMIKLAQAMHPSTRYQPGAPCPMEGSHPQYRRSPEYPLKM